ncbi:hypothetical protein [Arthrobacter sp. StoSoilB5]|uniref:hypothetical protein n=1 Tax=Arthrobacter sp. StoSoilB5 TaxID=2830992 RepID=UPI001CC5352A|nr:hypothetical protein [Arthrobacter sp. StoSoilB5]BCW43985.1 hypothetical protein StoSoilB5_11690 [Arthrobacter sp. StoSoilB5]
MNIGQKPEAPREVPEADAVEQQTPVLPEGSEESELMKPLPDDAPEADVLEQRTDVLPGGSAFTRLAGMSEAEAAEGDYIEQALAPSFDEEDDYRENNEEVG